MVDVPEDNPLFQRIEWLDALNTDHPEIDDDHRRLIDDTNIILAVLALDRPWAELIELVLRMRANCVAHFRREEQILAHEDYPDIAGHAAEHRRIEQELATVVDDLAEIPNPSPPARELALYFRSLLLNHFLRYDLRYKSHLLYKAGR